VFKYTPSDHYYKKKKINMLDSFIKLSEGVRDFQASELKYIFQKF